ncbi:MAG: rubredoxin [Ruminococcaceae bacterium]|nr:rubredoxin [Oscillospiraceae bacterium]
MNRIYVCSVCGYEYDESRGDTDNGVDEGTEFEDLPRKWLCPVCAADKEEFELLDTNDEDDL